MINSNAIGAVLPPAPKIILDKRDSFTLSIESSSPENGYDENGTPVDSENYMVSVLYPDDQVKSHQVKDVSDLCSKIFAFATRRYNIKTFEFVTIPESLEAGQQFSIGGIQYDA